jgi:hypothetical protein
VILVAENRGPFPPSALALGLVYSGLIALKPTFVLFAALHLPLSALAVFAILRSFRATAAWVLWTGFSATITLLSWIVLHSPNYWHWQPVDDASVPRIPDEQIDLFSVAPLFYGATAANYAALVGLAVLAMLWAILAQFGSKVDPKRSYGILASAVTAVVIYMLLVWLIAPLQSGYQQGIRYSIPFLLGIVPFVAGMAATMPLPLPRPIAVGIPVILLLACAAAFAPSLHDRLSQAIHHRNILAFSSFAMSQPYRDYVHMALSEREAEVVARLQQLIPANEAFMAWINNPFHLDFSRNPVLDVEPGGLSTPWTVAPPGVRYVMLEHRGFAIRTVQHYMDEWRGSPGRLDRMIAGRAMTLGKALYADGLVLYQDDRFVVYRRAER